MIFTTKGFLILGRTSENEDYMANMKNDGVVGIRMAPVGSCICLCVSQLVDCGRRVKR